VLCLRAHGTCYGWSFAAGLQVPGLYMNFGEGAPATAAAAATVQKSRGVKRRANLRGQAASLAAEQPQAALSIVIFVHVCALAPGVACLVIYYQNGGNVRSLSQHIPIDWDRGRPRSRSFRSLVRTRSLLSVVRYIWYIYGRMPPALHGV